MKVEGLPKWIPYSIYIATYHVDPDNLQKFEDIAETLLHKHEGSYSKDLESLELRSGPISGYVTSLSERSYRLFLVAVGSSESKADNLNLIPRYEEYDKILRSVKEALPKGPNSECIIRLVYAKDEKKAKTLLLNYLENIGQPLRSAGLIRGCLLASLGSPRKSFVPTPLRELVVLPYEHGMEKNMDLVWMLGFEACSLELYSTEMGRLYLDRKLMFDQMDASEDSTQLRINEVLAQIRRPVDEIQPNDLENMLKDIVIEFSRLSTTSSSMRRDYVKAQGILRSTRNLLKGWNERPFDENKTNTSEEIEYLENMIVPFEDFIERTDALMAQFNTVLDSVRTYLGIKQQKMSIMEQTSSKEQLVRLVNLQEILHKLEILIVAFYLTEMARIVFDTITHESANLLTVAFIPFALLISVLLIRALHKKR